MHARPMISVAATAGLLEAITAAGGNPDQILHKFGIRTLGLFQARGIYPQFHLRWSSGRSRPGDRPMIASGSILASASTPRTSVRWSMSS